MLRSDQVEGLRVWVVDDNDVSRAQLADLATSFGMQVEAARDGADLVARATTTATPPDVVLIDRRMPGMDGVTCAKALRAIRRDTPLRLILMVTAFSWDEAQRSADRDGVSIDAFLNKPVSPSNLLETIGRVTRQETASTPPTATTGASALSRHSGLRGAHVLLVEDNAMNRDLAVELLREAGLMVTVAADGREAVDWLLRGESVDGVLMDVQMPVMDGYEATAAIRKHPALGHLPIIAMTANAMSEDKERALAAGMNDHIGKPLVLETMFATLARWIRPGTTTVPPPVVPLPLLNAIPGLDIAAALTRLGGRTALLDAQIRRFIEGQQHFVDEFTAAAQRDPASAQRLTHTLKGQAGTIGAVALQQAAAELEIACRDGAETGALLGRVEEQLNQLLPSLAKTMHQVPLAPPADPMAQLSLDEQLAVLDRQLSTGDIDAADTAATLLTQLADSPQLATFRDVQRAITAYDFPAARARLAALRGRLLS